MQRWKPQVKEKTNAFDDRMEKPSPVMTASTEETQENEHQSDSEVSFKMVQREGEPNEDEASTRSSSPVLSDRTLQGVGERLKEFFDAGHFAAIQTLVTSKQLAFCSNPNFGDIQGTTKNHLPIANP